MTLRCLSTAQSEAKIRKEINQGLLLRMLPLRFNNKREILTSYRTPWQDELNRWRKNLVENRDGFADGM